jgi:hypothetical protein
MFDKPVVLLNKEQAPIAVLPIPVVLLDNASKPKALFEEINPFPLPTVKSLTFASALLTQSMP